MIINKEFFLWDLILFKSGILKLLHEIVVLKENLVLVIFPISSLKYSLRLWRWEGSVFREEILLEHIYFLRTLCCLLNDHWLPQRNCAIEIDGSRHLRLEETTWGLWPLTATFVLMIRKLQSAFLMDLQYQVEIVLILDLLGKLMRNLTWWGIKRCSWLCFTAYWVLWVVLWWWVFMINMSKNKLLILESLALQFSYVYLLQVRTLSCHQMRRLAPSLS